MKTFIIPILKDTITHGVFGASCDYDTDIIVSCRGCKKSFAARDLYQDEEYCRDTGDLLNYSNTVCPKCKLWDCCKIQYEFLETDS